MLFFGINFNEKAKKMIYFFKDVSIKNIEKSAKTFIDNKLNGKMRKNLINRLIWHQNKTYNSLSKCFFRYLCFSLGKKV